MLQKSVKFGHHTDPQVLHFLSISCVKKIAVCLFFWGGFLPPSENVCVHGAEL